MNAFEHDERLESKWDAVLFSEQHQEGGGCDFVFNSNERRIRFRITLWFSIDPQHHVGSALLHLTFTVSGLGVAAATETS